ncbi:FAD-dependent oxidoreductase [Nordella sp. HKS 07]|uniref:oxidoreductase n=1 Tax=Nordella sp. HKS 07 TaxID=2712222 RepID=UPI0013E1E5DF|nr:FAD-dependent oxidoreductase [Nordella sp. HKS 07]QIG47247.1 FAD-dependent oxidoreductase [Nordella sp. HKS 07]
MFNPRYARLFETVKIGPKTAPNRFYQTPHASGMGWRAPKASAALRGIKAEGGWGVVSTEYCSIHPSSDDFPFGYLSLWDEDDVRALAKTAEAIHEHGSLAAVELWHGGFHANNRLTREPLLSPSGQRAKFIQPMSARAMDKADIAAFRQWQKEAAQRARRAGFDIVYVYAGHDYLPLQFLSPRTNRRGDEYGGNTENRTRLLREMIAETRDAVKGDCAVALRLAVDELHGPKGITHDGEARDIVAILAELPDLWDVNVAGALGNDSKSARFSDEGFQEDYVSFVKTLTTKPVVGVGRFTSPDMMMSQLRRGILDFIGAARPSIADPFLPQKIREGREDEIRECIGCNICRAANNESIPLRCTQNPTMGEEWRRGWHPEKIATKRSEKSVLVVGGGPAGLECALALGRRGHQVALAEASRELGGRVLAEARLPGLASWIRVRDHRQHMIGKLSNVAVYRESPMTAEDVAGFGADHVVVATGSSWRRDAIGAVGEEPLMLPEAGMILTPDEVDQLSPSARSVIVYDDDHYAVGSALAEMLKLKGHDVTYVTPAPVVSSWTQMTDEQGFIQAKLMSMDVRLVLSHRLAGLDGGVPRFACVYTERPMALPCDAMVLVTGRLPDDALYRALLQSLPAGSISAIGDCHAPSHIADAVFAGHRFAREFGEPGTQILRRERPEP